MNYLRDRGYGSYRSAEPDWKKPAFMVVLVVGIYLWGSGILSDALVFATYPFLRMAGTTQSGFADALKTQKSLIEENDRLRRENEDLQANASKIEELEGEIIELRGLKEDGKEADTAKFSIAHVLVKPNHLPYDEIIIDTGKDRLPWLAPGKLVFAQKDVVLGQIETVAGSFAKVKLYSTGGVKIPVSAGIDGAPSIAEGQGSGNFTLTLPRGVELKVGDPIKTTMIGNYTLGYVGRIEKDPNNPFQKIQFRSPYNVFELEWILIKHD